MRHPHGGGRGTAPLGPGRLLGVGPVWFAPVYSPQFSGRNNKDSMFSIRLRNPSTDLPEWTGCKALLCAMLDSMAEDATVAGPTRSGRAVVAPGAAADPASAASPSTAPRDVIFSFCFTTLEGAERRGMHYPPERLVLALLERPRVRRLLIVDPFRSLPVEIVRRALRRDGRGMRLPAHATRPRTLRLDRTDPTGIEALERLYAGFDRRLRRAASAAGFERPAVITANPHVAAYS